ncbi:MAG TPA: hypothetical protein VH950_05900 [Gaiellaceae bacterium]
MSSELVGRLEQRAGRRLDRTALRILAIEALGPLTALAGVVWAIAQPYRITFLHPEGKGFYDFLVQPPLLVIGVGAFFSLVIARGLLRDLREDDGPAG